MGKLYSALRSVNVSDDAAREASAEFENRLAKVKTDLLILKWLIGANLVLALVILAKLLAG